MRVLIACEESQTVCKAFRQMGMRLIAVILSLCMAINLNG